MRSPTRQLVVLAPLAAAAAVAFVWLLVPDRPDSTASLPLSRGGELAAPAAPTLAPAEIETPEPTQESQRRAEHELVAPRTIRGRVLGLDGAPIAGATVVCRPITTPPIEIAVTSPDGTFAGEARVVRGFLALEGGWTKVSPCPFDVGWGDGEYVIVAAPRGSFGGVVLDEHGRAVARAEVRVSSSPEVAKCIREILAAHPGRLVDPKRRRRELGAPLVLHRLATVFADELGRFDLREVPLLAGAKVSAIRRPLAHDPLDLPAPTRSLVLRMRDPSGTVLIQGTVLHHDGSPAAGARVQLGPPTRSAVANDRGRFQLYVDPASTPSIDGAALVAKCADHEPAVLEGFGSRCAVVGARQDVELVLGPRLALAGNVYDERGRAVRDASVVLADATPIAPECGDRAEAAVAATTNGRGRFVIAGIRRRSYVLVWSYVDEASGEPRCYESEPVEAGSQAIELRPRRANRPPLVVRVVDLAGAPVSPASVSTAVDTSRGRLQGLERPVDARGVAVVEGLAPGGVRILVQGKGFLADETVLAPDDERDEIVVTVRRTAAIRLSGFPRFALDLEARAPGGAWAAVGRGRAGPILVQRSIGVVDGATVRLLEGPCRITVRSGDEVLVERDLDLAAGQTAVVTP